MKKILHFIHGINVGGAEGFIFNILKTVDASEYKFDFVIQNPSIGNKPMENFIKERGGKIYLITDFRKNIFRHISEFKGVLKNGYDYVHVHCNSLVNPVPVIFGGKYGAKVILHSHNTANGIGGKMGNLIHNFNRKVFINNNVIRTACGLEAGKWMHGNNKFSVIHNAVDLDKFRFSGSKRNEIRQKYNILEDQFIIGHLGRFVHEKNQKFLVDLLYSLKRNNPDKDFKIIFCGDGPLREQIRDYSQQKGLERAIIFTGNVNNPDYFYSAFDSFVLPSLFEGLAFVAVEAQAAGLPVIASDCNTPEIDITGNVRFLPLRDNFEDWEKAILNNVITDRIREGNKLVGSSYDLNNICRNLPYEVTYLK